VMDGDQGESELSAKLKVGRASLGEEREGSRVADISINAAWGGVQKGKARRRRRVSGIWRRTALCDERWDGMGWEMGWRGERAVVRESELEQRPSVRPSFPFPSLPTEPHFPDQL
jgi:hypothetical protein